MSATEVTPPTEALRVAPPGRAAPAPPPVATPRPRPLPRTTRVVLRRLDAWSVLKLSILYYLALFVVFLVAAVLLWAGASTFGVIENIESFMVDIGFEDFEFLPSKILGGVALGGLVLVVAGSVANVIMCALFNLMSDVTGGLKLTLQEDPPTRGDAPRRSADTDGGALI